MRKLYNKLTGDQPNRRGSSNLGIMKDSSGKSLFSSVAVGQSSSFGIKTDPLIKFSLLFCALIHDAGKCLAFRSASFAVTAGPHAVRMCSKTIRESKMNS